MGMFDWFRSSYDLGEPFTETVCQSKTFNERYRGFLDFYWLDPSGRLWIRDDKNTHDMVESDEELLGFYFVTNGSHGKVKPCQLSKTVVVYPQEYDGQWQDWPECSLTFLKGKLQNYETRARPIPSQRISN